MIEELKILLAKEIKNTKTLNSLDDIYIRNKLEKFILTNGDIFKKLRVHIEKKGLENIEKNKIFKEIVKLVRDELRIVYGSFLTDDFHKREKMLDGITKEDIDALLRFHKSTKERVNFYEEVYSKIFEWYKPEKIADVACGLNPLSYFFIERVLKKKPFYFASDLSSIDMEFIEKFFDKFKIKGVAKAYDVTDLSILTDSEFQNCDLVFLFKALDSFEQVKKNISKELLEGISANHIVISFPTKSLIAKKQFKMEKRNWLFNFLNKEGWNYEIFEVENELFILIKKTK